MRSLPSLSAACLVLVAVTSAPAPASCAETPSPSATPLAVDLGRVLPGTLHGGVLANLRLVLEDFPGIAHQGWLGERIDEWVRKGYPDPREAVGQVGVGLNVDVSKRRLRDLVLLGHGPLQLARRVKDLAREANLPMREIPYRGVVFLQPGFEQVPLWIADIGGDISHFHYDAAGRFEASKQLVETLAGQRPSFGDKHAMSLTPETYLVAGIQVPVVKEARARGDDVQAAGLHLVIHASVDWRRSGSRIQLGIELETFTPVEARLLADWLAGRIEAWKQGASHEVLVALLDAMVVRREGKHVYLDLKHDFELARQGFLAMNQEMLDRPLP